MSTDTLTDDDRKFIDAMDAAVAERGEDWVYPLPARDPDAIAGVVADGWHVPNTTTCVYMTDEGDPACLIGLALYKINPDLVPNYDASSSEYDMDAFSVLARLSEAGDLKLSERTMSAAYAAQRLQDDGAPWGQAIAKFDEAVAA